MRCGLLIYTKATSLAVKRAGLTRGPGTGAVTSGAYKRFDRERELALKSDVSATSFRAYLQWHLSSSRTTTQ